MLYPCSKKQSPHLRSVSLQVVSMCLVSLALQPTGVQAQSVTNYAFSQTAGTYTNITGGTVLISGNNWNNQVFSVTPLTAFPFLGQNQNTMYVSCNGFLTFGTAPAGNNITPLSNGAGYIGAISPFGANLVDRNLPTSEVRWQEVGSEIIVQWRDCRRKIAGNNELFSFQARLNTTNGTIRFVYSAVSNLDNSTAQQPQVGLRGANNTFPANVNARLIATGAETWATTLPATANSSKLRFTSTNPSRSPVSGQTYTFTPLFCTPSTVISADPSTTICSGISATFTAIPTNGGTTPTYAWTHNGAAVGSGPTYTSALLTNGDIIAVTMTSNAACAAPLTSLSSVTVTVLPTPIATAIVTTPILCNGGTGTITVSANGGISPYTGTGVFVSTAGKQEFIVTGANGCTTTATIILGQPAAIVATASVVSLETGCGGSDAIAVVSASGGTPGYSGIGTISGLTAGNAVFTVTDANACLAIAPLTIPIPDTDGDGTDDCGDECPDDPNKTLSGECGCDVDETDSDGDSVMDCNDNCPNDPLKVNPGNCGCGALETDTDGDTYADCVDGCPNDPLKISAGSCGCGVLDNDTDGDGLLDCIDPCPNGANPGAVCDDGNAATSNDVINASCTCVGTPTSPGLVLSLTTDNTGVQTSWEIVPLIGGAAVCGGSNYANNTTFTIGCPINSGSYVLRVMDTFGDGLCCMQGNGGYALKMNDGRRIIDNLGDGGFTYTSSVALGFELPLGPDHLTPNRCDREDYLPSDFIQTVPNAAVRAQYGITNANSGYQFWFFDPDGGYSRRMLVTHATSSYLFPFGADRCSYLRLSSMTTSPLPFNKLLNVRVRSMVNGVYNAFGSACRLRIDLPGLCPTTQLVDDTNDPKHSCGLTNVLLDGSRKLWAVPVSQATNYRFRFVDGGYQRNIVSSGSSLLLTEWTQMPLQYGGKTYQVNVQVSYDNGANWCPFGATCTITTAFAAPSNEDRRMALVVGSDPSALRIWPNPTDGDRLNVHLEGLFSNEDVVQLRMIDLQGRLIIARSIPITDDDLNVTLGREDGLTAGIHLLTLSTATRTWTERVVVQ